MKHQTFYSFIAMLIASSCREAYSFSIFHQQNQLFNHNNVVFPSSSSSSAVSEQHHRNDGNLAFSHRSITTARRRRNRSTISGSTTTSLSLTSSAVATVTGVLTGGMLSGALHGITGPDHIAALLPKCCGQRWYKAGKIGLLWGLGQTVAIITLGSLGYALKSQLSSKLAAPGIKLLLSGAANMMEVAIGFSLIVIGAMGLREAKEWGEEMESIPTRSLSAAVSPTAAESKGNTSRAVIFNGILHGFSWDGAPSLAPALAVASWGGNLAFLSAYSLGIVGVMTVATSFIGEGTRQASELFERPDLPQKLSYFSSLLAIVIGGIWCGLALK